MTTNEYGTPVRRWLGRSALAGLCVGLAGGVQAATLSFDNQQIRVSEFLVDPAFTTAEEVVLVGDGVELDDFGTSEGGLLSFDIDIGAAEIGLVANQTIPQAPGAFGFAFADDMSAIMRILAAEVTSATGFTGISPDTVRVVDDGNGIVVDFDNVGIDANAALNIGVTFAEAPGSAVIPLPATLPLALGGFAALFGLGRRSS